MSEAEGSIENSDADSSEVEFEDHLEERNWDFIRRKLNDDHWLTDRSDFLSRLVCHDAPVDLLRTIIEKDRHFWGLLEPSLYSIDPEKDDYLLTPLTVASIYSSCKTFRFVLDETKKQLDGFKKCNPQHPLRPQHSRTKEVFSNIGLIPLDRLRVLFETFPNGCRDRNISGLGFLESDQAIERYLALREDEVVKDSIDSIEKFVFVLKMKLQMKLKHGKIDRDCLHDGQTFLVPHALLTLFLSVKLDSEDLDGKKWKETFLQRGVPVMRFLFKYLPAHFTRFNNLGQNAMHIFLANVSFRGQNSDFRRMNHESLTLPKEEYIREHFQFLLQTCLNAASLQNKDGRLPLHIAAENGAPVCDLIVKAYPAALRIQCPVTKLYPFQLAALSCTDSFRLDCDKIAIQTVFDLLRGAPEIVYAM